MVNQNNKKNVIFKLKLTVNLVSYLLYLYFHDDNVNDKIIVQQFVTSKFLFLLYS
jgi:hypothetical protein